MKTTMKYFTALTLATLLGTISSHAEVVTVDAAIQPYEKTSGVTGNLNSIGSDTPSQTRPGTSRRPSGTRTTVPGASMRSLV